MNEFLDHYPLDGDGRVNVTHLAIKLLGLSDLERADFLSVMNVSHELYLICGLNKDLLDNASQVIVDTACKDFPQSPLPPPQHHRVLGWSGKRQPSAHHLHRAHPSRHRDSGECDVIRGPGQVGQAAPDIHLRLPDRPGCGRHGGPVRRADAALDGFTDRN